MYFQNLIENKFRKEVEEIIDKYSVFKKYTSNSIVGFLALKYSNKIDV